MKSWIDLGDLNLIFKVTLALKLLNLRQKNACLQISWTSWQILTKWICLFCLVSQHVSQELIYRILPNLHRYLRERTISLCLMVCSTFSRWQQVIIQLTIIKWVGWLGGYIDSFICQIFFLSIQIFCHRFLGSSPFLWEPKSSHFIYIFRVARYIVGKKTHDAEINFCFLFPVSIPHSNVIHREICVTYFLGTIAPRIL